MRLILLVLFLSFSPSLWAMGQISTQTIKSSLIGKLAPDVVLSKSDGTSSGVINSRQGKKAIVVFWATWCPHCNEEIGSLNNNISSIEQKGIKLILVDVGETREVVNKFLDRHQLNLISFIDENSFLQDTYHLVGIPTIIFIDEKGIVCNVTHELPVDYANYFRSK